MPANNLQNLCSYKNYRQGTALLNNGQVLKYERGSLTCVVEEIEGSLPKPELSFSG